jgi:hypothetical protein
MKLLLIALTVLVLGSCATPPGQIQDSDLLWEEKTVPIGYEQVYRNIVNGFRTCGPESPGMVNVSQIGVPECVTYPESKEISCDVYIRQLYGGRSDWIIGFIRIKDFREHGTTVRVGVKPVFKNQTDDIWLQFAEGKYTCKPTE